MKKTVFIPLIIVFTLSGILYAQDSPDFTGVWKLDKSKSQLQQWGNRESPDVMLNIIHDGKNIKIETIRSTPGGKRKTEVSFEIGGKSKKIQLPGMRMGRRSGMGKRQMPEADTRAKWKKDKKTLIITTDMEMSRRGRTMKMTTTSTYSLSEDGKTLTIMQERATPRGTRESIYVYNKFEK